MQIVHKERLLKKIFKKPIKIRESWENTPGRFEDTVEFLNWFDATSSIEDCLDKSRRDWMFRFKKFEAFSKVKKEAALEIGFGGGRLLLQASKDFNRVYGVDVHSSFGKTKKFLESQGCVNATLIHRDELVNAPYLSEGSIDFIYSFIVFQHFDGVEEVLFYLKQIKRLLSKDGYAHIYFGKSKGNGTIITSSVDFQLRDCSLFMDTKEMRGLIEKDFIVEGYEDNLFRDPETNQGESAQAYVIFRKSET